MIDRLRAAGRWLPQSLLVGAVLIATVQSVFYFTRTVDDLFISLRYAEHLSNGVGLVYNPGEHVEGFSSPLWVLLQAGAHLITIDGVSATKALSAVSLTLLGGVALAYARQTLGMPPPLAALGVLFLASNSYLMAWTWLGLETPLYLALLLAWPLTLQRFAERPRVSRGTLAGVVGTALGMSRPEAPLFVALLFVASLAHAGANTTDRQRQRHQLALVGAAVVVALVLLLLARFAYYDSWLPHTFDAKRGDGFAFSKLTTSWWHGAHTTEKLALPLGVVAGAWLAKQRRLETLLVILGNALFVCSVQEDWMPNQRHMLPTWLFGTLAGTALAERGWTWGRARHATHTDVGRWRFLASVGAVGALLLMTGTAAYQLTIDSRFSPKEFRSHGRSQNWVRFKSRASWRDAWLMLKRVTPPHMVARPVHQLGMITQLFRVLENAPADEDSEWYLGRDIGRVGYYSPIRVFDTDGLFTPAALTAPLPERRSRVRDTKAAATLATSLHPLAGEVYEGWPAALAPLLPPDRYRIVVGNARYPIAFVRRGTAPAPTLVLERYERVRAKLPQHFHLSTLYGECVGAAIEKRYAHVRDQFSP